MKNLTTDYKEQKQFLESIEQLKITDTYVVFNAFNLFGYKGYKSIIRPYNTKEAIVNSLFKNVMRKVIKYGVKVKN